MTSPAPTTPPTYEDLAHLELDFEDIDTEILARQEHLSRPLYTRRRALTSRIQNFWPLVFEQAPPELDTYIQPTDSQIFASCLQGFEVERFETAPSLPHDGGVGAADEKHGSGGDVGTVARFGEPRSLAFRFEFGENEWFEDKVVEKRFWYRRARNGWAGRVSEPVKIRWKKGKDVTGGLLDAAVRLFEAEKKAEVSANGKGKGKQAQPKEYAALQQKVESTTAGSQSFFTWFGYRGPPVGVEESAEATQYHERKRQREQKDTTSTNTEAEADDKVTSDADAALEARFALAADVEIFPDGEELAISLAEELWPSATKYFVTAQEDDGASNSSFEASELDEEMEEEMGSEDDEGKIPDLRSLVGEDLRGKGGSGEGPPSKKRRT